MPQSPRFVSLAAVAFVAAATPWTVLAEPETGDDRRIRQAARLRAVAGHRVEMNDGGPVLRADVTRKLGTWQELIVTISGAAVRGALTSYPKVTVDPTATAAR